MYNKSIDLLYFAICCLMLESFRGQPEHFMKIFMQS